MDRIDGILLNLTISIIKFEWDQRDCKFDLI